MIRIASYLMTALSLLTLVACGSGGGDGGTTTTTPITTTPITSLTLLDMGSASDLPGVGWQPSAVTALNASGMVVGDSQCLVTYWDSSTPTSPTKLFPAHGSQYDGTSFLSCAYSVDINDSGIMIAYSTTIISRDDPKKRGFVVDTTTDLAYDLDPAIFVPGTIKDFSHPVDINANGDLAVTLASGNNTYAYFVPKDAWLTQTNTGVNAGWIIVGQNSEAVALNDHQWMVYNSGGEGFWVHPVYGSNKLGNGLDAIDVNDSVTLEDPLDPTSEPRPHVLCVENGRSYFWEAGAVYEIVLPATGTHVPVALNNNDQALINVGDETFIWQIVNGVGSAVKLGSLAGGKTTGVTFNNLGQAVGYATTGATDALGREITHAVLWDGGTIIDLQTHEYFYDYIFEGAYPHSRGADINENGDVAGNSISTAGYTRGFVRPY